MSLDDGKERGVGRQPLNLPEPSPAPLRRFGRQTTKVARHPKPKA